MSSPAWVLLHQYLPQRLLGRCIYALSRSSARWIKSPLIGWFARNYRVDLDEAESADLEAYPTFNAFFTRALRPGARAIDADTRSVISPVDGRLTEFGTIAADRLLQAKGHAYTLADLLGADDAESRLHDGVFATIYLAPRDYHRVHAPLAARLLRAHYLAGKRYLVNAATARRIPRLFCRNERLVCWLETDAGLAVMVLVGALNVSSIGTSAHGEISSGASRLLAVPEPIAYEKGQEFGRFNLGSTVILLFERHTVTLCRGLASGTPLKLGMRIGTLTGGPGATAV